MVEFYYNSEEFHVGDEVKYRYGDQWVHGKVVHIFPAGSFKYNFIHYVVEVETHVDDYLYIIPDFLLFNRNKTFQK